MKKWFDLSIKRKTTSVIMLICGASLLLSSLVFFYLEIISYRSIMVEDMMTMADIIGANSTSAIVFKDVQTANETLKTLKAEHHVRYSCILDTGGRIFAAYKRNPNDFRDANESFADLHRWIDKNHPTLGHHFTMDTLELYKEIVLDGERIGTIFIEAGLEGLYRRIKKHTVITGFVLLVILVMAFLMSAKLQKVITDPITRLLKTIDKVTSEGTYSIRAESIRNDEIGELINGFNSMLNKIEFRDRQLAQNRMELEERVDLRTIELKEANQNLEQMIKTLAEAKNSAETANQTKSDFLANMSHELRTPLNHIIGFTELVTGGDFGDLNDIQREYLQDVLQSSKHLLSLINDILDLSKVESGKLELQMMHIQLKGLLERSLNMVKEVAMANRIHVSLVMDDIPERILADERKLKQIIFNLLSNAVKFTPKGGQICLMAKVLNGFQRFTDDLQHPRSRSHLEISVVDMGIGIQNDNLERIFNPFEQVESSTTRKYQGTGLGLSLTRRLVELHGGKIWAESKGEGLGSTFKFILPL